MCVGLPAAAGVLISHLLCLLRCAVLQYVKDVDVDLARDAIRAVGQIALKVGWLCHT